jgi:hypothetical protein
MSGPVFCGEDAFVLDQPLSYSIVSKTKITALKLPTKGHAVKHFTNDVKDKIKLQNLTKYGWLYKRL